MIGMTWCRRVLARTKSPEAWIWFRPRIKRVLEEVNDLGIEVYELNHLLDHLKDQLYDKEAELHVVQGEVRKSRAHLTLAETSVRAACAALNTNTACDPKVDAACTALDVACSALYGADVALGGGPRFDHGFDADVQDSEL